MKTSPFRRATATLLAVMLMLVGTATSALAVASGSATIEAGENLVAGVAGQTISFEVTNDGSEGLPVVGGANGPIDLVQFSPPSDLFDGLIGLSVRDDNGTPDDPSDDVDVTADWRTNTQSGIVRFLAKSDDAKIARDDSLLFDLTYDVVRTDADTSGTFFVSVSDDSGSTLTTAGILDVLVRTLELDVATLGVVKPDNATNGDVLKVTEGQTTAKTAVEVTNFGGAEQQVTVSITRESGSSTVDASATTVTLPPAPADGSLPAPVLVELPTTFGDAGTLVLRADASSAEGSEAQGVVSGDTITVQEAVTLEFDSEANSFTPSSVNPDADGYTSTLFEFDVIKRGEPAVTVDAMVADTGGDGSFTIGSITQAFDFDLPAGDPVNDSVIATLSVDVDLSDLADGEYTAAFDVAGFDANGASLQPDQLVLEQVLIDTLGIELNLDLIPPAAVIAHADVDDAASYGDSVGVDGTALRGTGAEQQPCGNCVVRSATISIIGTSTEVVAVLDGDETDITINGQGEVEGSISMPARADFDYPVAARLVQLELDVTRVVGEIESVQSGSQTATAPVDVRAPELRPGLLIGDQVRFTQTGRDDDGDYVDVYFNEKVSFGQTGPSPTDFNVPNSTVTSVQFPGDDNSTAASDFVRLRLAEVLANNAEPTVRYIPPTVLREPGFDRVDLNFGQADNDDDGNDPDELQVNALDGIAPDILTVATVSTYREDFADTSANRVDLGPNGTVFTTRDASPVLVVDTVLKFDEVTVFVDSDADGVRDDGERILNKGGEPTLQRMEDGPLEIELDLDVSGDTDLNLGLFATDENGNEGLSPTGLVLSFDRTAPVIADFTATEPGVGSSQWTITVDFDELLTTQPDYEGAERAMDWFVHADGRWRPVGSVEDTDADTRTLRVDTAVLPAGSEVTKVRYEYVNFGEDPDAGNLKDAEQRYLDRALNEIVDGVFSKD